MKDELLDILCGDGQGFDRLKPITGTAVSCVSHKVINPAPITTNAITIKKKKSLPMTVLGVGGEPVIVEDPVRFRKDIQAMVMAQMSCGYMSDEKFDHIIENGSMIEIATINQMRKAARGDLHAYTYMMDRVLGKPVNQTNSVSLNVSYEDLIGQLDPNEEIVPDDIIDVTVVERK